MKLKKCKICKKYTLQEKHCSQPTINAGYKFIKIQKESL